MKNQNSLKNRLKYWFDNRMAEGFWPKVRLLLIITIIFIALVALLAALSHGGIHKNFLDDFIRSFMYTLGKGGALNTDDAHVSVFYFILMLLTIIYCIFFSAILIGLINNALRSKVEDLGKGHSLVIEKQHVLILGFNDSLFVLLKELVEANKNQKKPQTIVILGNVDQKYMIEQIQQNVGWPKRNAKTRFICRTGSIYNFDDLKRCSIESSRSVIINASTDFESIKAIMAVSNILSEMQVKAEKQPFFVSIIQDDENLMEAKSAAGNIQNDNLIILALNEVLARIMVHTSRQPGLSDVFTELFNFIGSEFYILDKDPSFSSLYGKTIADINQALHSGFAIGVKRPNEGIIIDSPLGTSFEQGDSLIVVAKDDDALKTVSLAMGSIPIPELQPEQNEKVNVLIIGVEPVLEAALREYANYLLPDSSICIVDHNNQFDSIVSEKVRQLLSEKGINLLVKSIDPSQKRQINYLLDSFVPDCVLVLAHEEAKDPKQEDELIMRTLIYLREYRRRTNFAFSITCEMLRTKDRDLAAVTGPDDFIISRHFAALMMSQISQNKEMASLFETLLSNKGFEIYMKPVKWYIDTNETINMFNLAQTVADRNEVLIGIHQKKNGSYQTAEINPVKMEPGTGKPKDYVFGEDDYLVVLSATSQFPELSDLRKE